jgi:DNA-binding Xre family transcriptional regulator
LSELAGVNLRMIQQYEGRSKDINKAAGAALRSLAQVLSCRIEDILEY